MFHIWILKVRLDLIALLSPRLISHCLGELPNTISVFRSNEKAYKEGINQQNIEKICIKILNFLVVEAFS